MRWCFLLLLCLLIVDVVVCGRGKWREEGRGGITLLASSSSSSSSLNAASIRSKDNSDLIAVVTVDGVDIPPIFLKDVAATINVKLSCFEPQDLILTVTNEDGDILGNSTIEMDWIRNRESSIELQVSNLGRQTLFLSVVNVSGSLLAKERTSFDVLAIPAFLAIIPFITTIGVAIISKQVHVALLVGMYTACFFAAGYNPFIALLKVGDQALYGALSHSDMGLLLFTFFMSGMIGVINKAGGFVGLGWVFTRIATTARRAQLATLISGVVVFFDDYSNSLVVGPTMKPVCDANFVSREKLAFLIDATSAPIAAVAVATTWIGFQLSVLAPQLKAAGVKEEAFAVFLRSVPYSFYSFLMMSFVLLNILLSRDFGPMLTAELRARREHKLLADDAKPASNLEQNPVLSPDPEKPARAINAIIPIVSMVITMAVGLYVSGKRVRQSQGLEEPSFLQAIESAETVKVLIWATVLACFVAVCLVMIQRIASLHVAMEAWVGGIQAVIPGVLILIFSWGIGEAAAIMNTSGYVVTAFSGSLSEKAVPSIVFVFSAILAFTTGSSWGCMAMMFPIAIPLAARLSDNGGEEASFEVVMTSAAILNGAIFGDHCSPISDTTVFASMASTCDHLHHFRTQVPYAVSVGVVAFICSLMTSAIGPGFAIPAYGIGIGCNFGLLMLLGRKVPIATVFDNQGEPSEIAEVMYESKVSADEGESSSKIRQLWRKLRKKDVHLLQYKDRRSDSSDCEHEIEISQLPINSPNE